MIIKIFNLNFLETNTTVLIDEETKDGIIIDLGGDYDEVFEYIKKQDGNLKFILNTHGHFDHIAGEAVMQSKGIDTPVYMSERDLFLANGLPEIMSSHGVKNPYPPVKISKFIDETSTPYLGKYPIKILETPGHTPGSLCFIIDNILFSGDTVFKGTVGRCDLEGGSFEDMMFSLKTKILPLDDNMKIIPGHGETTSVGEEKLNNPYLRR